MTAGKIFGRAGRTLLVAIALAEVGIGTFLITTAEDRVQKEMAAQEQFRFATLRTQNPEARFAFRYPPDWEVTHERLRSELTNPGKDVVVALGRAPSGDLLASGEDLKSLLDGSYPRVRETSKRLDFIRGEPALITRGRAVNDAGSPLHYWLVIIEGQDQNFAISSFISTSADRAEAMEQVHEVVRSFDAGTF